MARIIRKLFLYRREALPGAFATCLALCCFLFAGCGSISPDQRLVTGTGTSDTSPSSISISKTILPITVVDGQSNLSTYPGGSMTLAITTSPYAVCAFTVSYGSSTPSKALGIVPRNADANGNVNWRWQVESGIHTGTWPLAVTAILPNGAKTSTTLNVTVTLAPINVVSSQSTLTGAPKTTLTLTVMTAPSATCTLVINYGPSIQGRTIIRKANGAGTVVWTWPVDRKAGAGTWPLTITAALSDGESSSTQINMQVL